ncbi:uncharacterized protein LOC119615458, partial [Lucilia sericata]|uniref:uncharacterized protein LOC119615458 n=1 Tax=Lucilia sericata TaxID=13632 RepID=UPI0018A8691C
MDEYLYLKHMQPASSLQDVKYFIPHHCITKPDSSTTRLRVVFDASCCTTSGKSLNDILCVGPTLQDDIFTMLSRFRYHKYVLVADIAKMYRQVLVHNDDMQWQCILWRSNPSSPLIAYKLQTLTYGTSSAPYLAVKCLQQLASEMSDTFPLGAKVTLSDFYVDNLMTGGKSEDEVIEIKRQVVGLLKSGGFPLRKFASNSSNILLDIPNAEREEIVQLDNMDYIKTLGLKWSPKEDFFSFSYTPQDSTLKSTKRSILAHTAAFFDPLGLINPIIVKAKILLQSLWKLKLHWDESVPLDIFTEWEQIRAQLKCLNNIKIPRFVSFNSFTNIHAFADASKKAYGACIYVVSKCEDGMVSSLVCAKSRVAPVKEVSLPRLELCAALLSVKLLDAVRNYFPKHPCKTFCWSDSTITLAWIAGESYSRPTFVANRITKIQELSKDVVWKHVPSEQNPADLLSRGSTVKCITENDFWFQGPSFLREAESNWPRQPPLSVQDFVEQRQTSLIAKNCGTCTIYEDFLEDHKFINSFEKLLRMMVYRPKLQEQVMAALPADRVQASFPFQVSGVDYCGPFQITQRAIHMELVPDLTTIAFIAALRRFISRRGRCATIYSDNATNFIGANKELKAMLSDFLSEEHIEVVREACLSEGITWNFIPPRSPHFGGLWESGVKQAKHYLRRAIGKHILTYDELNTVVCQTEAILNSRPLTPLSSDPNDLRPLTPAHFLIGRPLTSLPEPNLCTVNPSSLKSYKLIQWIQQHFWERWRKEYLNCLQQKLKWNTASPNIEINDLVLLKDDNIPPLKWPLARVIAVNPGDDGFVRVATVKSKDG